MGNYICCVHKCCAECIIYAHVESVVSTPGGHLPRALQDATAVTEASFRIMRETIIPLYTRQLCW